MRTYKLKLKTPKVDTGYIELGLKCHGSESNVVLDEGKGIIEVSPFFILTLKGRRFLERFGILQN